MPLIALVAATLAVGFETLVESRFGPMGIIALLLLSIGVKARNAACTGIGTIILVMLVA
ncbi:hypothetical protein ACH492_17080 [Streptomyces sp. NPDC019443]|uniref:hypothetical protein n=1 Tax=Streptomyces sp. NPDC019443 TaxID=3365061 RepID=UPI0037A97E0A